MPAIPDTILPRTRPLLDGPQQQGDGGRNRRPGQQAPGRARPLGGHSHGRVAPFEALVGGVDQRGVEEDRDVGQHQVGEEGQREDHPGGVLLGLGPPHPGHGMRKEAATTRVEARERRGRARSSLSALRTSQEARASCMVLEMRPMRGVYEGRPARGLQGASR